METTRLLEDRIAVRPDAPETETEGGIITPNPQGKGRGTVVACGPGKRITGFAMVAKTTVKIGDVVLYGRFTGGEIAVGGESLLLMRECDIVAVVESVTPMPEENGTDFVKHDRRIPEKGADAPGKTAYDACCGANCDCGEAIGDLSDKLDRSTGNSGRPHDDNKGKPITDEDLGDPC